MPRPGHFTPGKNPVRIVKENGRVPGLVWTGAEKTHPAEFDPRNAQAVVSRYTHYAILAPGKILLFMGDGHIKSSLAGQQRNC
jgi:hypothetical protein